MAGINPVIGEWWWIPCTRGLKRGCPMNNKNQNKSVGRFALGHFALGRFARESFRPYLVSRFAFIS